MTRAKKEAIRKANELKPVTITLKAKYRQGGRSYKQS